MSKISTDEPTTLLDQAKQYVDEQVDAGRDWQSAVNDILSEPRFAPLFEGLSDEAHDALCVEISMGAD